MSTTPRADGRVNAADNEALRIQIAEPAPKGDQAASAHTVKAPAPSLSSGGGLIYSPRCGSWSGIEHSWAAQRGACACVCVYVSGVCVGTCRVCSVCGDACGVWGGKWMFCVCVWEGGCGGGGRGDEEAQREWARSGGQSTSLSAATPEGSRPALSASELSGRFRQRSDAAGG